MNKIAVTRLSMGHWQAECSDRFAIGSTAEAALFNLLANFGAELGLSLELNTNPPEPPVVYQGKGHHRAIWNRGRGQ